MRRETFFETPWFLLFLPPHAVSRTLEPSVRVALCVQTEYSIEVEYPLVSRCIFTVMVGTVLTRAIAFLVL